MIASSPTISRETLCRIVEAATLAPSAENLQPWRFELGKEELTICLDMGRQLESDVGRMLGLTGIGTCVENAAIAASVEGLRANVEFLVDKLHSSASSKSIPISRLHLRDGGQPDPLADFLASRCTSRRMDPKKRVSEATLRQLGQSCNDFSQIAIHWVGNEQLAGFAQLVGIGNRIRFEHQPFHAELYLSMRFSVDEAKRTRDGLDIAALQLPPGIGSIMRALRTWPMMKWANFFGFSRGVSRQATQEVIGSGAVGFLTVPCNDVENFVSGGRALERIWLTATRFGLCFHPTASLPVFLAHARAGGQQLLPRHRELAESISKRFCRLFPMLDGQTVQMAFRVGYGPKPPIRTLRRPWNSVVGFCSEARE